MQRPAQARAPVKLAAGPQGAPLKPPPVRRQYAVIGAGLAGIATAWHLLDQHQRSGRREAVDLHLYDVSGVAAGGSGAAAGLLHPYNPRGKMLWQGAEATRATLELLEAAAAAAGPGAPPFVWRHGLVRPAVDAASALLIHKACSSPGAEGGSKDADGGCRDAEGGDTSSTEEWALHCMSAEELLCAVAGVRIAFDCTPTSPTGGTSTTPPLDSEPAPSSRKQRRQRELALKAAAAAAELPLPAALHIPHGLVLDVRTYLAHLWRACQVLAGSLGGEAELRVRRVSSLQELEDEEGCYDAVVVAAGAASATIRELSGPSALPLELVQGHILVMEPAAAADGGSSSSSSSSSSSGSCTGFPDGAPSLLGNTYLAAQGSGRLLVGATQVAGWDAQRSLELCASSSSSSSSSSAQAGNGSAGGVADGGGSSSSSSSSSNKEQLSGSQEEKVEEEVGAAGVPAACGSPQPGSLRSAVAALLPAASAVWPPLEQWRVVEGRAGVRANPPRGPLGSIPIAGRMSATRSWWVCTGLGARGLVYHAWVARALAAAVVAGGSGEGELAAELRTWLPAAGRRDGFEAEDGVQAD